MTTASCQTSGAAAPADRERALYASMLRLRRFEEKAGMMYALGTIATPCPLGYGQEGALAALMDGLQPTDVLISMPPRPAVELALGAPPAAVFQRLVAAADPSGAPRAIVRGPGNDCRLLDPQAALRGPEATKAGTRLILVFDPADIAPYLAVPGKMLAIVMIPSDRRPETWPLPPNVHLRECDGTTADAVSAALTAAREAVTAGSAPVLLAILTPPYAGHARDAGRRTRRDAPDPIALYRQHLISSSRLSDADATAIETAVRDEIATAGRAISLACAP